MKHVFGVVVGVLVCLGSFLSPVGAQQPKYLKINWRPGDIYRYQSTFIATGYSDTQTITIGLERHISLAVCNRRSNLQSDGSTAVTPESVFLVFDRAQYLVDLQHESVSITLALFGQTLETIVTPRDIGIYMNGRRISTHSSDELVRKLRPVQMRIQSPIRLALSDRGAVLNVSGPPNADAQAQLYMARDLLESLMLPQASLRPGAQFSEERSIRTFIPRRSIGTDDGESGETITLITLRTAENGHTVAVFTTPVKQSLHHVSLDDGERGTVELDLLYTTVIDVDLGLLLREIGEGTAVLKPHGARPGDYIYLKMSDETVLTNASEVGTAVLGSNF